MVQLVVSIMPFDWQVEGGGCSTAYIICMLGCSAAIQVLNKEL